MEYVLGIDVGTYESKGVIVDREGRIAAESSVGHEMSIPRPGWAEADAEAVWWRDFLSLTRRLLESSGVAPRDIAAVGCSAIGPCVLPVDRSGRPLRSAILYGIDTRATDEIHELSRALGEDRITANTGSTLSSQAGGPKILWIRRHEPDVWRRTARIMTSTSYLVYRLTGRVVIDHYTAAAYAPLYNLHTLDWDPRALSLICERELLPDLDWSVAVAGTVYAEAAAETGLAEGTPVSVGTADAAAEAVAAGVLDPGDTMLMYGSSHFFIRICRRLIPIPKLWPTVYLQPGSFALAAGMSTTGSLTRWFRDNFAGKELEAELGGGANAYQVLAEEASRVPRGADGLMALPYFSGERTPLNDPAARGVVVGLTLSHTRAHLYRAFLEAIAYGIRHNLDTMKQAGAPPRRLVAIGGGVRNELWTQIVSDVTGCEQLVRTTPGASFGDAMIAAAATGMVNDLTDTRAWPSRSRLVQPSEEAFAFYRTRYPLFRDLYERTKEIAHVPARE